MGRTSILTKSNSASPVLEIKEYQEGDIETYVSYGYRYKLICRMRGNGAPQPNAFGMTNMAIAGCEKMSKQLHGLGIEGVGT